MSKEWILNIAINRWGLQKKKNVGPVSEEIRKCSPKNIEEWEQYYYENVRSKAHLEELGRKLYTKISEVLHAEIQSITEEDCIEYIKNLVIKKTFEGYITEKKTIYEQLQELLGTTIYPASDEWDRKYNVDFYIQVRKFYIGLQIKPITFEHAPQYAQTLQQQHQRTSEAFSKQFGGKVFYIFSIKKEDKKVIYNTEVISQIQQEIKRLEQLP
ncbi:MAG: MjaI family restriction endonuclease [Brevinematales bacterium]|nr:MjaI family restriction endonuclease [Brevinematales bacterium]